MTDIIIPTFNQEHFTVKCMQSIGEYTSDYRIVWVDNGSTPESRAVVMEEVLKHPHLTVWLDKNYGFVKAVNAGLKAGDSEFVVLQNNDTEVTWQWLERLLGAMKSDPSVMCCGGMTDTDGSWQGWRNVRKHMLHEMKNMEGWKSWKISKYLGKEYKDMVRDVAMIAFFSTLFRRSAIDQLGGGLDEAYGAGLGDDDDACCRFRKAGGRVVFVPSVFVYHHHRTTFKSLYTADDIAKMQNENLELFKKRNNV